MRKGLTSSLRHKIWVEQAVRTSDGAGGYETIWEKCFSLWAAVTPKSGSERVMQGKNNARYTHIFRVRYHANLREDMRIIFDGRAFNIRSIINKAEDNKVLDIYTEEGVAD